MTATAVARPFEQTALALIRGEPVTPSFVLRAGYRSATALDRALVDFLRVDAATLSELGSGGGYRIRYGGVFHVSETLRYLARDPNNLAERVSGITYERLFPVGNRQVPLTLTLGPKAAQVAVRGRLSAADRLALHRRLVRFLGLDQPLKAFYRSVSDDPIMAPLAERLQGVRISQVPSLWEALCWAIIGQQINLSFAYRLRNRFIALGNGIPLRELAEGFMPAQPMPFPQPEQILAIAAPDWREAQFSRQKTAYLQELSRAFLDGRLSETGLESADLETAEATLLAVKGLGPWSVAYGLLRALGRVDALPVGDAGLRAALRHLHGLDAPPDARRQLELMEPYRPFRGLATAYLWKSLDALRQD